MPASEEQAQLCEQGKETPSTDAPQLFFGKGWENCLWNDTILKKLIGDLLEAREKDADGRKLDIPDVSDGYLLAIFHNFLKEAHEEWSRSQPRVGESEQELQARVAKYNKTRQDRNVLNSRKKNVSGYPDCTRIGHALTTLQKFEARQTTTQKMMAISLAAKKPGDAEAWKWLKEDFLEVLGAAGMSSEEDETLEAQFGDKIMAATAHSINLCPWRVLKATEYLVMIDQTAEKVKTRVTLRRPRIRSQKESQSDPPLKLPRAMYDEAWLSKQREYFPNVEEIFEITDEEFILREISVDNSGTIFASV